MRDQAEWLLGNIIPIHVADQLKVFAVIGILFYIKRVRTVLFVADNTASVK